VQRLNSRVSFSVCLIAVLSLLLSACQMAPVRGGMVQQENLLDGVYEGSYRSGPNSAVVKVTISKGEIVNIELVKHVASWKGKQADHIIPQRIMAEQSTDVDAVSGATNSSRVIMNAVQNAVEKAHGSNM